MSSAGDAQLAADLPRFYADPLGYVMYMFPWDDPDAGIQQVPLAEPWRSRYGCEFGPDKWACEFLEQLGEEILDRGYDGQTAVDPIMFATASGHGIGKSVLVAWLIKFILDTRPFAKGVVTAGTADQLRTKTWAELGKWHSMSLTAHHFHYRATRGNLSLAHRKHSTHWRCDAHTCKEENSESFAGLHAANSTPFFIFDEATGVPNKIYEVRDGGTTDGEPMVFDFGNPTKNSGRFFDECVGDLAKRFIVRCIDSRTVHITNKSRIQDWIEDYGEDSDWVKVRVRGVFPSAGAVQFIPRGDVEAAMRRPIAEDKYAAVVMGVDVARFGPDDSVIYVRKGNDARSFGYRRYKHLDTVQLTGKVIEWVSELRGLNLEVAAIFVDATGGSIGGGVLDQLAHVRYRAIGVQFGNTAIDNATYRYRGDEMWGAVRDALHTSLALPSEDDPLASDLKKQLTSREFGYTVNGARIHLESKDSLKDRMGLDASPDIADALALTYASPVAPLSKPDFALKRNVPAQGDWDYDPLETNW